MTEHIQNFLLELGQGVADIVKADSMKILYGRDFFMEKLMGLEFKVTPFSFFRTNSRGAEALLDLLYTTGACMAWKLSTECFSGF